MRDELDSQSVQNLIARAVITADQHELSEIILSLQSRGTIEVFDAAYELCVDHDSVKRILGFRILEDLGTLNLTFPNETQDLTLHLLETESDPNVLSSMARVLARVGGSKAIEALEMLQKNSSPIVRYGVVTALSYLLNKPERSNVIPTILRFLTDPSNEIRFEAVGFLSDNADLSTEEIRRALIEATQDGNSGIRGLSLLALVRRNDPTALDLLMKELKQDHISTATINAAAELKSPQLYPMLQDISAWWTIDPEALAKALESCKPNE
jgi:HEAT repeat protein